MSAEIRKLEKRLRELKKKAAEKKHAAAAKPMKLSKSDRDAVKQFVKTFGRAWFDFVADKYLLTMGDVRRVEQGKAAFHFIEGYRDGDDAPFRSKGTIEPLDHRHDYIEWKTFRPMGKFATAGTGDVSYLFIRVDKSFISFVKKTLGKKKASPAKKKSPAKKQAAKKKSPAAKKKSPAKKKASPAKKKSPAKKQAAKKKSPAKKQAAKKKSPAKKKASPAKKEKKECVRQYEGRYVAASRKSPPYPANPCKNRTMRGNDGNMWKSVPDKRSIYHWKKIKA